MKNILKLICTAAAALLLLGCTKTIRYQEEVLLSTGKKIVIDRVEHHKSGGGEWATGTGYHLDNIEITFKGDKEMPPFKWKTAAHTESQYVEIPVILDVDGENGWFIYTMARVAVCQQYIKYRLIKENWVRESLGKGFSARPANLILGAGSLKLAGLVTIDTKKKVQGMAAYAPVRQIGPDEFSCPPFYIGPMPPTRAR